ncbi:unnamed protein product [Clonostachys rosea f. rosea IK726]|uniref:Uncharacterized protein n=2 Tax=Bionectria ochroleuca TaxID=29856 RepID=A0A0B7JVM4_BIOOC|nr:unnamed protein product [Clonostachys rosea f. rosea IK726]
MAEEDDTPRRLSELSPRQTSVASTTAAGLNQHVTREALGLKVDTRSVSAPGTKPEATGRTTTFATRSDRHAGNTSPEALRRRFTNAINRSATFRTVEDLDDFDDPFSPRPGWQPGSEPGYDPLLPDGGHASMEFMNAPCQITVVDFSHNRIEKRHYENQGFIDALERPQEPWAQCRWINVNGLSWDVLQAVGSKKGLHKLALEDVMNLRNRTKADWYSTHAYINLTLQKLVHLVEDDEASSSTGSTISRKSIVAGFRRSVKELWRSKKAEYQESRNEAKLQDQDPEKTSTQKYSQGPGLPETTMLRTVQRYHASSNEARIDFMERHSSLVPYKMAVSAEQVSIFLTSDNTVISFFEVSAGDIERPIITRLSTAGTILRECCDASLLVQAIIDAIIDLAMPITTIYADIIGDLELDVLTAPHMDQSISLYIVISEINKMLTFLNPIDNLVNVLRDHKTTLTQEQAVAELRNPKSGVIISPMTHTYFGDVLDHCIMITENLQQSKRASDNLIDLIFNTISSHQNESMKQLTAVTIIFLPLTFITGFFGQNFDGGFPEIHRDISYFWMCAVPTAFATILILMRNMIHSWFRRMVQRKQVLSTRRRKKRRKSFVGRT